MAHGGGTKKSRSSCCLPLPPAHDGQSLKASTNIRSPEAAADPGESPAEDWTDVLSWTVQALRILRADSKDRPGDRGMLPSSHTVWAALCPQVTSS